MLIYPFLLEIIELNLCDLLNSDLAFVQLSQPITFTSDIGYANISCTSPDVGMELDVTGGGAIDQAGTFSDGPLTVTVPVIDKVTECFPTNFNSLARLTSFCTSKAACFGDSGGPAAKYDSNRGLSILYGLVAYGGGTLTTDCSKPCGYTDVSWFKYAIKSRTGIDCV